MSDVQAIAKLAESGVSAAVLEAWLIADTALKMKDAEPLFEEDNGASPHAAMLAAVLARVALPAKEGGAMSYAEMLARMAKLTGMSAEEMVRLHLEECQRAKGEGAAA